MRQVWGRMRLVIVVVGALLFAPSGALASSLALAPLHICVNDECRDLSSSLQRDGDLTSFDIVMEIGGSEIQLFGLYDADPFITFGATTTNAVAGPVTYAFVFGTPVVPGFYNTATSSGGLTLRNGLAGTATVAPSAIYPTYISGYGTVGVTPTNLNVDLGSADCVASGAPGAATVTCNQGTVSNTFAPTFYDNLEALLTYTQTDFGSVASWSGSVTLTMETTTVPEPASILFLGPAALGLLAHRRMVMSRTANRRVAGRVLN